MPCIRPCFFFPLRNLLFSFCIFSSCFSFFRLGNAESLFFPVLGYEFGRKAHRGLFLRPAKRHSRSRTSLRISKPYLLSRQNHGLGHFAHHPLQGYYGHDQGEDGQVSLCCRRTLFNKMCSAAVVPSLLHIFNDLPAQGDSQRHSNQRDIRFRVFGFLRQHETGSLFLHILQRPR